MNNTRPDLTAPLNCFNIVLFVMISSRKFSQLCSVLLF